jgi:hypothetical protein
MTSVHSGMRTMRGGWLAAVSPSQELAPVGSAGLVLTVLVFQSLSECFLSSLLVVARSSQWPCELAWVESVSGASVVAQWGSSNQPLVEVGRDECRRTVVGHRDTL